MFHPTRLVLHQLLLITHRIQDIIRRRIASGLRHKLVGLSSVGNLKLSLLAFIALDSRSLDGFAGGTRKLSV